MCVKIAYRFTKNRSTVSSVCSLSCEKSERSSSINQIVAKIVREAPSTSIYRRSQELKISETSLRRILLKNLGMTPYKVQLVQELKPIDHPMRFHFVKLACHRFAEDADFGKKYKKINLSDKNQLFR